jgi:transposase
MPDEKRFCLGKVCPSAQDRGQILASEDQTCSYSRSFTTDPIPATGKVIGVDLGVKTLATTSEAEASENPKALQSNLKKLARLGCRHSRKVKGSKNRKKAARKLAQMHARIAKIRQNALHQATTAIAKTKPCVIVLEDLNAKGLWLG